MKKITNAKYKAIIPFALIFTLIGCKRVDPVGKSVYATVKGQTNQTYYLDLEGQEILTLYSQHKNYNIGDTDDYFKKNDQAAFFKDKDYNYLSALYFFTRSSGFKCLTAYKERSAEAKRTIDYLMTLKPIPNLKSTKAWSAERMNLFPYLDTFLIKTK